MRTAYVTIGLGFCLSLGCQTTPRTVPAAGCMPTYSQFHSDEFRWGAVGRVLVLPFRNESEYTRAAQEISKAFRTELQQIGRFEVIDAPPDDGAALSTQIHRGGRFNEETMLRLRRAYNVDVVIHGTVTTYSPYPRPKVGLVIQAVSPATGKVVASVDGLWDANNLPIAKRAQGYYTQRHSRGPYLESNWIFPDDGHADELALLSPALYQRFVSSEAVGILVQDPSANGLIYAPHGSSATTPNPLMLLPDAPPPVASPVSPVPPALVPIPPSPTGKSAGPGKTGLASPTETGYNPSIPVVPSGR